MIEKFPQPNRPESPSNKVVNLGRWLAERHGDYSMIQAEAEVEQSWRQLCDGQDERLDTSLAQVFADIEGQTFVDIPNTRPRWSAYLGPSAQNLEVWDYPAFENYLRDTATASSVRGIGLSFEAWQAELPPVVVPEHLVLRFIKDVDSRNEQVVELIAADLPRVLGLVREDGQSTTPLLETWNIQYPELLDQIISIAALYRTGLQPDNEHVQQFTRGMLEARRVTYKVAKVRIPPVLT